jgi:hypothetical protein
MIEILKLVIRGQLAFQAALFILMTLAFPARFACAHEVETTRLSLVQREPSHVSATFYVNPFDFFQPVLDAQVTQQTAYVHLASLDDEVFAALYARAQAYYKQKITFKLNKDKWTQLSNWQFSNWQLIKKNVQQQLAQQLVSLDSHVHFEPVQFTVQLTGDTDLSKLQPKLPAHWGKVLVIASKPQQIWIDSSQGLTWIKF